MGVQDSNERRFSELAARGSDTAEGLVTAVSWSTRTVTVNVAGVSQSIRWVGPAPWPGDRVRVTQHPSNWYCELVMGAPLGTVQSVASSIATVLGDDGVTYTYPHESGVAPSAGWRVRLDHAGRMAAPRYSAEPLGSLYVPPPAPPNPTPSEQVRTFNPIDSANWWATGGRWDTQYVEVSVSRSGFYFYGTQIADTIPNSATILSATASFSEIWDNVPGTPSMLGSHGAATRPGSPPGLSGALAVSGSGDVNIASYANALKNGTQHGLGFAQNTGWRRFQTFAGSGAITIRWRT